MNNDIYAKQWLTYRNKYLTLFEVVDKIVIHGEDMEKDEIIEILYNAYLSATKIK